jgi:hypothetical protein
LEIPASDPLVLIDFYATVFGWQFEKWGAQDYWVIRTGDEQTGINGGLVRRQGFAPTTDTPVNAAVPLIGVWDCRATHAAALAAGARETLPVTPVPGVGTLAYFQDPDNNHFGIIEPTMAPPSAG